MARPLRVEFPGACYHITVRGNRKDSIFFDDADRKLFLSILAETIKTHNWRCYAYCLMGNHFHLLVETIDPTLSCGMRDLDGTYTQKFNKKHGFTGHLFEGRFKAFVIDNDMYLEEVARYIVLNPVRAGLVKQPGTWAWSSYRATAGFEKTPRWLSTNAVLDLFSSQLKVARREYIEFVQKGIDEKPSVLHTKKEGVVLGEKPFLYEIWEKTQEMEQEKEIPREERMVGRPSLEEVFDGVHTRKDRDSAICFARKRCGYLLTEIARFLGINRSTVGKIVRDSPVKDS